MRAFLTIISLMFIMHCFAQEVITEYYDNASSIVAAKYEVKDWEGQKLQHGWAEEYYEDGTLKNKCAYTLGSLHGDYISYYKTGAKEKECRYTNGYLNGELKLYYPSGNLKERMLLINGKIQGEYRYYNDVSNSDPIKIEHYKMGKKL